LVYAVVLQIFSLSLRAYPPRVGVPETLGGASVLLGWVGIECWS